MSSAHPVDLDDCTAVWGGSVTPRVAIIGAGLGGLGQAVELLEAGVTTFTVFEKSPGPGGTWWDNTYPGAACDVPSLLYSFDFMLVRWKRTHATQREIQAYLEALIDRYDFRSRIRFGVGVVSAVWSAEAKAFLVTTHTGEQHWFDVVVSAVGMLNVPRDLTWPGAERFRGEIVHSARWGAHRDLDGKRVAVVGAGASAAQIIPAIVDDVAQLVSFQREPSWVMPKAEREFDDIEYAELGSRRRRWGQRAAILEAIDAGLRVGSETDGAEARRTRAAGMAYLDEVFAKRPDLKAALTPTHPLRCKRTVQSNTFLQALTRDHVTVVPRAVEALTERGVVDDAGLEHEVDLVVLATGFQTTNYLATVDVRGENGRSIHDVWGPDPRAFLGITVPGFPNFFMLYGPNTHGTVVSYVLERQAEFVAATVRTMVRKGASTVEARRTVAAVFDWLVQRGLAKVVAYKGGCHSYYHSATGRNVTQWPWSHTSYRWCTRWLRRVSARFGTTRPRGVPVLGRTGVEVPSAERRQPASVPVR